MIRWRLACASLAFLASACAEPGPAGDPELRALVDSLLPVLETLSGLPATGPVNVATRSPQEVRRFIAARLDEDFPVAEVDGIRSAYAMLGLVPDTLDLRRLLADLYAEQIVGYYDPDSTTLYVIAGVPTDAVRPVLAHELVHALQDQHIDLDSLIARDRGNDRQLAAQAAIEGHATLVMLALQAMEATGRAVDPGQLPDPTPQLRAGLDQAEGFPVFRSAPRLLREALLFPYANGAGFVWRVWAARPAGERPALAQFIPASTEQVLDPGAFLEAADPPTELRFESTGPWRVIYENTFGALETRLFFEIRGGDPAAARGWDGDRYRVLETPEGGRVLVWHSVWDDAESAVRFAAAVRPLAGPTGSIMARQSDRPTVTVVIGQPTGGPLVPAGAPSCPADGSNCLIR